MLVVVVCGLVHGTLLLWDPSLTGKGGGLNVLLWAIPPSRCSWGFNMLVNDVVVRGVGYRWCC